MSRTTNSPVSVAEALEVVAADDSWLNDGVTGVIHSIKPSAPNAQKKFWRCVLADAVNSSATIDFTLFFAPKFSEGDRIEIVGKGVKRKEYEGKPEVGVGKSSEIHVLGKGVAHEQPAPTASATKSAAIAPAAGPAQTDAAQGPRHVHGQTVGMALKEALALVTAAFSTTGDTLELNSPAFWAQVHTTASDIIRLSNALEKGNLAPSVSRRAMTPEQKAAEQAALDAAAKAEKEAADAAAKAQAAAEAAKSKARQPGPANGQAFPTDGPDEDVPF